MSATDRARDLLTIEVYSPLHRRPWRVTDAQYRVMVDVFSGWMGTERDLADRVSLSKTGLHKALASLVNGGLVAKLTTRGRKGRTLIKVRSGVFVIGNGLTKDYETTSRRTTNVYTGIRSLSVDHRDQGVTKCGLAPIADILKEVAS